MTSRRPPKAPVPDPEDYPVLRDFLRGYLHEDFEEEYGSAVGALVAFVGDAGSEEAAMLRDDWARFSARVADLPFSRVRRILTDEFGTAYLPANPRELAAVFAPLTRR